MRIDAQATETRPLMDAELVLLIDHDQTQAGEAHVFLHERLRADHKINVAGGESGQCLTAFRSASGRR